MSYQSLALLPASVEEHGDLCGWVVKVGEQFELDDGSGCVVVGDPTPDSFAVRLELGVHQRFFQAACVHCAAGDLEIDLYVDVGRTRVHVRAGGAQQMGTRPPRTTNSGFVP